MAAKGRGLGPQATRGLLLATFHQLSPGRREALLAIPGTQLPGDEELVTRLARIVDVYSIRSVEGQGVRRNLYQQASLINHSCEPNMVWYPLQGHIVVRVVREVVRGEELTVSYTPTHLAAYTRGTACPTLQQRRALLAPYRFTCACRLCLEGGPAEEGAREVFQVLQRWTVVSGQWTALDSELEAAASLNHQLEIARRKLEESEDQKEQTSAELVTTVRLLRHLAAPRTIARQVTYCQDTSDSESVIKWSQ